MEMIQFVEGLPKGIYVGQTRLQFENSLPARQSELEGFNLALHVGDDEARVHAHRIALMESLKPFQVSKMTWLQQTHSTICHVINDETTFYPRIGDGLVTQMQGHALMIMTADCLPIVFGNDDEVANIHAGWRGLASGIIENTIKTMKKPPTWAWLGACIGQNSFEIGLEVKEIFCEKYAVEFAFITKEKIENKAYADLYAIAAHILKQFGVVHVLGGKECTFSQNKDYFSYRRQPKTGRMATFVFINKFMVK